jgi:hypothetical protein
LSVVSILLLSLYDLLSDLDAEFSKKVQLSWITQLALSAQQPHQAFPGHQILNAIPTANFKKPNPKASTTLQLP